MTGNWNGSAKGNPCLINLLSFKGEMTEFLQLQRALNIINPKFGKVFSAIAPGTCLAAMVPWLGSQTGEKLAGRLGLEVRDIEWLLLHLDSGRRARPQGSGFPHFRSLSLPMQTGERHGMEDGTSLDLADDTSGTKQGR